MSLDHIIGRLHRERDDIKALTVVVTNEDGSHHILLHDCPPDILSVHQFALFELTTGERKSE